MVNSLRSPAGTVQALVREGRGREASKNEEGRSLVLEKIMCYKGRAREPNPYLWNVNRHTAYTT